MRGIEANKLAKIVERLEISEIATTMSAVMIILKIMYIGAGLSVLFHFLVLQMRSKE